MQGEVVLALAIMVPIIIFPAALVWYINIGGITAALKEARAKKAAESKGLGTVEAK